MPNSIKNMPETKSLMQRFLEAGYPIRDMFHHHSDLYVYATALTNRVIEKWCMDNGFRREVHIKEFNDAISGRPMYDCAFAYIRDLDKNREVQHG